VAKKDNSFGGKQAEPFKSAKDKAADEKAQTKAQQKKKESGSTGKAKKK
jgi:hypothetical protein